MQRLTLWHEPQYFQFFIQDPASDMTILEAQSTYRILERQRFYCGGGLAIVRVVSEFTRIPVAVEFDNGQPEAADFEKWDRIIECSIEVNSGEIAFVGCPDGPIHGKFGSLMVIPGRYRLRVYFGGQDVSQDDGETGDFYLIQVWPSEEINSVVIKGHERSQVCFSSAHSTQNGH